MTRLRLASALAAVAALACTAERAAATTAPGAALAAPPRGVVRIITTVDSPGYPAFPLVVGDDIYEGTYTNPKGDSIPSHIFEYDGAGHLLKSFVVPGQDLSQDHGVQVATEDARGNLILLDDTSGRIMRLNPRTGVFSAYGTVADLPTCNSDHDVSPCSPALVDLTPEPDYAAWGPDGSLYVTDYQQAVIWRVPPGGGKATVWLAGRELDGALFGTAGLVMLPDHHTLMFDQASSAGLGGGNPTTGKLYTVPIERSGAPGPLHQLWESAAATAPDGFALARSGDVYMAQVGPSGNDIIELSPQGRRITNFGDPGTGFDGAPIPFDEPSGVGFLGSELVVANQSYLEGDPAHMALLGLGTGEPGAPVYVPKDAGIAPPKTAVKKKRRRRRKCQRLAQG